MATGLPLLRQIEAQAILVLFSGGKDSWATLSLCRQVFERVEAVHFHLLPGLEVDERHLRRLERDGIKVHRLPIPGVVPLLRDGGYRPHIIGFDPRPFKQTDLLNVARARSGIDWSAAGERTSDSIERRGILTRCQGIDRKRRMVFPVWDWPTANVYRYLRGRGLPAHKPIGSAKSGGVGFREGSLRFLRDKFPGDYARLLDAFPWAEAVLVRADVQAREKAARKAAAKAQGETS